MRQEDVVANGARAQRFNRERRLAVREQGTRQGDVGTRAPILVAAVPNARRAMEFVYDQVATGKRLRVVHKVDDVTEGRPTAVVGGAISGARLAETPLKRSPSLASQD
jgi:putative transposase